MSGVVASLGIPLVIICVIIGLVISSIEKAGKTEEEKQKLEKENSLPMLLFKGLMALIFILYDQWKVLNEKFHYFRYFFLCKFIIVVM
jgi:cell division protein FtsW (lipid II flippase)